MKYLLFSHLTVFVGTQVFFREALIATSSTALAARTALSLETRTFEFPGAGEFNNNRIIGDFCCTGKTATVRSNQGTPVGYIYFHDFAGGINIGSRSAATRFAIRVSGVSDAAQPKAGRVKSSIEFASSELKPGSSRSAVAGALQFTVTILDVQFVDEPHSRYWMDSVSVRVGVQDAPAAQTAPLGPLANNYVLVLVQRSTPIACGAASGSRHAFPVDWVPGRTSPVFAAFIRRGENYGVFL